MASKKYYRDFREHLGAWTKEDDDEDEAAVELAVRGDYFVTGKKQTGQRQQP